jgi:hypothetical protein
MYSFASLKVSFNILVVWKPGTQTMYTYVGLCRARILKHFMEVEKITFRLKKYFSNHTCIFRILKDISTLSRTVTSTSAFSQVAKEYVSWPQWQTAA